MATLKEKRLPLWKSENFSYMQGIGAVSYTHLDVYKRQSLNVPTIIELKAKNHLAAAKKQKFGFKEAYYSSGFFSIWLPPKIS